MGHSFDVHCRYYRTPEINTQITKLAKLFMTLENVDPSQYRGKSMEELNVDELTNRYQRAEESETENQNDHGANINLFFFHTHFAATPFSYVSLL